MIAGKLKTTALACLAAGLIVTTGTDALSQAETTQENDPAASSPTRSGRAAADVRKGYTDEKYRFSLTAPPPWTEAPLDDYTVPGVVRAAWSGTDEASIVVFVQEPGEAFSARCLVDESARSMKEKFDCTIQAADVKTVDGKQAMWMVATGKGTGGALDGRGDVETTTHWVAIPREKDIIVVLLTCPAADYEAQLPLFGAAIQSLKVEGRQTSAQSQSKSESKRAVAPDSVDAQTSEVLNLGFEQAGETPTKPKAWTVSGDGFATDAEGYQVGIDEEEAKSGKRSLRMKSTGEGSFGNAYLSLPGIAAAGKHVKISGWIKTKDVAAKGYAGLWCRIDGPGGVMLAHDNMALRIDARGKVTPNDRGVRGTTDWKLYSVQHDVPTSAKVIVFGALLTGEGTAWWDDFAVEIDGKPYRGKPLAELAAEREPKPAELEWLRKNAIAFETEKAGSGFDDLQPLKTIVGDARIVGLGEATHGTAEFFRMKHRLVEFLASEMGFTHFAIEANMPEAYRVNDYVLNGNGDPKALLRGMYFWTWDTEEVLDMILWMRQFNASGKGRIQFLGFDMQTAAVAAENARGFVAEVDPDFAKEVAEAYDGLDRAIRQASQPKTRSSEAKADGVDLTRKERVKAVLKHMEGNRGTYLEKRPAAEIDWAIQNARVVAQAAEMVMRSNEGMGGHRDRCMAENVNWILAQAPPGSKIVLWAHNGHVSKEANSRTMGSHLAKWHGKDYVVLGFALYKGRYTAVGSNGGLGTYGTSPAQPGSIEYYTHATGLPRLIIDLRRASKDDPDSAWLTRELDHRTIGALARDVSLPSVLPDEYDALIAIDDTTASKSLRFATASWKPNGQEVVPDTLGWKVLFADAFDRESLGEAWATRTGIWSVADSALQGVLESNRSFFGRIGASIKLKDRPLPPRVEVRFACRVSAPMDLLASLTADQRADNIVSLLDGGVVELLGTRNADLFAPDGTPGQKAAVVRGHRGEFLAGNPSFALEPDQTYRVRIIRDGGKVMLVVEDAVVVAADLSPGDLPSNSGLSFSARYGKGGTRLILDDLEIRTP